MKNIAGHTYFSYWETYVTEKKKKKPQFPFKVCYLQRSEMWLKVKQR